MAVIRSVPGVDRNKHQVIVRKMGHSLSRVFWTKSEAEKWARRVEDAIASATPDRPFEKQAWLNEKATEPEVDDTLPHAGWPIWRALIHYAENITPTKKGAIVETYRIGTWGRASFIEKTIADLTTEDVQTRVNERLAEGVSGDTVRRELNVLRAVYRDARKIWGVKGLPDPFRDLTTPRPSPHRERRLEDGHEDRKGEEERLRVALGTWKRQPDIHIDMFDFSIETGLRLSELHAVHVRHIRRAGGVVRIELGDSKNDDPRRVVLSGRAREIAERRSQGRPEHEKLFPISDSARRRAWAHARKVAGVHDLRWHDLRHEAVSRMASAGLHLGELMAQSGHRDVESLKRYTNAKARDIAAKLG